MRRNFDQKYRDKYIAVIIDPFVKTNADIRFFVMDDVKNSTEGRKKGGFIPSLKKMLTEYISTTPLPTPEQIRDPFGLEDAFEEVGDPEDGASSKCFDRPPLDAHHTPFDHDHVRCV